MNELNRYIKSGEFDNLFPPGTKLPQVDSIRNTMKQIDVEGLRRINKHIVNKAIRNKIFEYGMIELVVAIDTLQTKCLSLKSMMSDIQR